MNQEDLLVLNLVKYFLEKDHVLLNDDFSNNIDMHNAQNENNLPTPLMNYLQPSEEITQLREQIDAEAGMFKMTIEFLSRELEELRAQSKALQAKTQEDFGKYFAIAQQATSQDALTLRTLLPNSLVFQTLTAGIPNAFYWCKELNGAIFLVYVHLSETGAAGASLANVAQHFIQEAFIEEEIQDAATLVRGFHKKMQTLVAQQKENFSQSTFWEIGVSILRKSQAVIDFAGLGVDLVLVEDNDKLEVLSTDSSKTDTFKVVSQNTKIKRGMNYYLMAHSFTPTLEKQTPKKDYKSFLKEIREEDFDTQLEKIQAIFKTYTAPTPNTDLLIGFGF